MQRDIWEKEYRNPKLIKKEPKPQNCILTFLKYLRKEQGLRVEGLKVLDLGSGTGRNANYLAERGNDVVGMEISDTALSLARERATEMGVEVNYLDRSIGRKYPFPEGYFDVILDVTSSNSLDEAERMVYLEEVARTLKDGGYFFVRALAKDKNAKNLMKIRPGSEDDTYVLKELGLTERAFSEEDFRALYGKNFEILKLQRGIGYVQLSGQRYKRTYLVVYMRK